LIELVLLLTRIAQFVNFLSIYNVSLLFIYNLFASAKLFEFYTYAIKYTENFKV